jgi:hypothetical protein
MSLLLYKQNAASNEITRKSIVLTEQGVPHQISWGAKDIDDRPVVIVPMDATAPRSKIATQSILTSLAQQFPNVFANINPRQLSKMLGLPDPKQFLSQIDPDEAKAEWENGLLMQGVPVIPEDFDVHDMHIYVHNVERKSPAYELADPQIKQIMDMHIMAHMALLTNETAAVMAQSDQAAMGMQDPGVTAALQAGVGLPMQPNGLQQEEEMMAEEMGEMPDMGEEAMLMSEQPTMFGGM